MRIDPQDAATHAFHARAVQAAAAGHGQAAAG